VLRHNPFATIDMRGNTLCCNTSSTLQVHHLLQHGQVAITRSSNSWGVALVVATPTTVAKAYVATPKCCKSKTQFATLSRKALSKALPTQAPAMPPNEKKVLLFLILQLFWAYCNTFWALKQDQNLVVTTMPLGFSYGSLGYGTIALTTWVSGSMSSW